MKNHQAYALHILLCIIHVQTKPCYICQHKLPLLTIFGAGTLYGKKRGGGEEDWVTVQCSCHCTLLCNFRSLHTVHSIVTFLVNILLQTSTYFLSKLIKKTRIRSIWKVGICFQFDFNPIERGLIVQMIFMTDTYLSLGRFFSIFLWTTQCSITGCYQGE